MNISKLAALKDDDELSPSESADLNRLLSNTKLEDIPESERKSVENYLASALNVNSVDRELVGRLDVLLEQLQAIC